eukprot:c8905_g1_i1.p1 GENE.c8905_g1_i1~~c8905_g1_i1.p1  ORF type:complete len:523 (+),score=110.86 c8905_g1_i1:51-1571(+)
MEDGERVGLTTNTESHSFRHSTRSSINENARRLVIAGRLLMCVLIVGTVVWGASSKHHRPLSFEAKIIKNLRLELDIKNQEIHRLTSVLLHPGAANGNSKLSSTLITWENVPCVPCGIFSELVSYMLALEQIGIHVHYLPLEPCTPDFLATLPESHRDLVLRAQTNMIPSRPAFVIRIVHFVASQNPNLKTYGLNVTLPSRTILRAMTECDEMPHSFYDASQYADEVWVPTEWNRQVFVKGGIPDYKISVLPETTDFNFFQPIPNAKLAPKYLKHSQGQFVFLSVFKFEPRKGWDVLLRAFGEEFVNDSDVLLFLKLQTFSKHPKETIIEFMKAENMPESVTQNVKIILDDKMLSEEIPLLYSEADAFVLSTRGEGWGLPIMEAMAMDVPVIVTGWSGPTAFLEHNKNGLLVDIDGISSGDLDEGTSKQISCIVAQPSVAHLRKLMRQVVECKRSDSRGSSCAELSPSVLHPREAAKAKLDFPVIANIFQKKLERTQCSLCEMCMI